MRNIIWDSSEGSGAADETPAKIVFELSCIIEPENFPLLSQNT